MTNKQTGEFIIKLRRSMQVNNPILTGLPYISDIDQRGFALLRYMLRCVHDGNRIEIEKTITSASYEELERLFVGQDLGQCRNLFNFVPPLLFNMAVESGLPVEEALETYFKYVRQSKEAANWRSLLDIYKSMFLGFADIIYRYREEGNFSRLVRNARDYVNNHLHEHVTLAVIADELNISPSRFSHIYKQETGESMGNYIRHRQIELAKLLLCYTPLPLSEVGGRIGCNTQSWFTSLFRNSTGLTPRQYRERFAVHQGQKIIF